MVCIRKIKEADYDAVCALLAQVHDLHASHRPDIYKKAFTCGKDQFLDLLHANHCALVAQEDGCVAGFCHAYLKTSAGNAKMIRRNVVFIDEICVDAAHRRRGIGSALLEQITDFARESKASSIELMVWSFNQDAISFYKNHNMTERSFILEKKID